ELNIGEGSGLDGSGAGAGSGNTIENWVTAYIQDKNPADSQATVVTASDGGVTVAATDLASILAIAGGVGIGIKVGEDTSGAALSVGISVAINKVNDSV